mgnify:CR=1 FL=1
MPDPIDRRAFEAMEYAAPDLTAVDISMEKEGLSAKDLLASFGVSMYQQDAEKSFNDFIGFLPSMSKLEVSKLEELWIAGGKPFIKIHSEGETGFSGDKNRAYFRSFPIKGNEKQYVDMMGIFKPTLLDDFMAEISHLSKYALKEGESKESWIKRREKIEERISEEKKTYGEAVYGKMSGSTEKWFPTKFDPEIKYTLFDPETRLGSGGERLTEEFEAHKVVEDSLWDVWGDIFKQVYEEEF